MRGHDLTVAAHGVPILRSGSCCWEPMYTRLDQQVPRLAAVWGVSRIAKCSWRLLVLISGHAHERKRKVSFRGSSAEPVRLSGPTIHHFRRSFRGAPGFCLLLVC